MKTGDAMKPRPLPLLVAAAGLALNSVSALPPESSVSPAAGLATVPVTQLYELWEKSRPAPVVRPPVPPTPVALAVLRLEITLGAERSAGKLTAHVSNLTQDWQRVSLLGGEVGIEAAEGAAILDLDHVGYGVLLEPGQREQDITAAVSLPGQSKWTAEKPLKLKVAPGVCRNFELLALPKQSVLVANERRLAPDADGKVSFTLAADESELDLGLVLHRNPEDAVILPSQALISSMTCQQRLVMDGGLLTTLTLAVRHQGGFTLPMTLPPSADVLQSSVVGKPVQPTRKADVVEFTIPTAEAGQQSSAIELCYFTKLAALTATPGTVTVGLPHTSLFHEKLEWTLALPEQIQATGFKSNAEPTKPIQGAQILELKREFWKADPVTAEVFYTNRQR